MSEELKPSLSSQADELHNSWVAVGRPETFIQWVSHMKGVSIRDVSIELMPFIVRKCLEPEGGG